MKGSGKNAERGRTQETKIDTEMFTRSNITSTYEGETIENVIYLIK